MTIGIFPAESEGELYKALRADGEDIDALPVSIAGATTVMIAGPTGIQGPSGPTGSVGATGATIRNAFLTEAAMLSLAGALLGYLLGQGGAALIRQLYPTFPAYPPDWAVLAGLGTALLTGVLFGVQPARRAARLDPVLSLAKH